jgi:hypothetical protein
MYINIASPNREWMCDADGYKTESRNKYIKKDEARRKIKNVESIEYINSRRSA